MAIVLLNSRLRRIARELNVQGRSRMSQAELAEAIGEGKEVPAHLSFMELLAIQYEAFAQQQADIVRSLKQQLDTYSYESPRVEEMKRWLRAAERDLAEACERAALYRRQAAA